MCFIISTEHSESQIAKKDIVCYKVLDMVRSRYWGPYMGTEYRFNRVRKAKIVKYLSREKWKQDRYEVEDGLHSFTNLDKLRRRFARMSAICNGIPVMFEAIIPKGAEYYINPAEEEYVSNQLMIVKRLNK